MLVRSVIVCSIILMLNEKTNSNPVLINSNSDDVGDPLILTPYIEKGDLETARNLSKVAIEDFPDVESYSGFFTVDKSLDSNLFFWYFPAEEDREIAPVILWLQGGPGYSSLFGLFIENGPFEFIDSDKPVLREHRWSKQHNVIYIDNPVGVGFSFAPIDGYATNETQVGEQLHSALQQFFKVFPELQQQPFYATGESYGGKYVPALAYTIFKNNEDAEVKINLKGVAIGNGLIDPINQHNYSDYMYNTGLIDFNERDLLEQEELELTKLIQDEQWLVAYDKFWNISKAFRNASRFSNIYNYLYDENPTLEPMVNYSLYLETPSMRRALHVGNLTYINNSQVVEAILREDQMMSVANLLVTLLDNDYKVLIFNGQLDVIIPYPLTENFLLTLDFKDKDLYKKVGRQVFHVDGEIAGYMKTAGKLTEALIRNAGHMVPHDQPLWAYELIHDFTRTRC